MQCALRVSIGSAITLSAPVARRKQFRCRIACPSASSGDVESSDAQLENKEQELQRKMKEFEERYTKRKKELDERETKVKKAEEFVQWAKQLVPWVLGSTVIFCGFFFYFVYLRW